MMTKQFVISGLLALFLFSGCNNTAKQKQESTSDEESPKVEGKASAEEQSSRVAESKAGEKESQVGQEADSSYEIEAQFEMMIANTAGTHYVFTDKSGDEYDLFPTNETEGMEFANELMPGETNHEYNGAWYLLTVQDREVETPGGKTERSFVLKAQPMEDTEKVGENKWDSEVLKQVLFFGVEPNWTLKLTDNYAEYTPMGEETKLIKYRKVESESVATLSSLTRGNTEDVLIIPGVIQGSVNTTITIKKEPCSDGMSDNTYNYSVELNFKDATLYQGCGRIEE